MIVEIFSEHNIPSTTWIGTVSTDWFNANNWSNGIPSANKTVTIPPATNPCIINGTATAYNVKVLNGGSLTINTQLTITDIFVNFGSVLISDFGLLTQINQNVSNIGDISVNRTVNIILNDYVYWSSPTHGSQTLQGFSPNSNLKYFLSYSNGWSYVNAAKTTWNPPIGIAILAPKGLSTVSGTNVTFQFVGTPNNGNYSLVVPSSASNIGTNLIGNPYPTRLNADKFIITNSSIVNYISFWSHFHPYSGGSYNGSDYITYNLLGGLSVDINDVTRPTKWIDAGVGFVLTTIAPASGTIIINNDMKFDDNFNIQKHRLWLNLTTTATTDFNQTLIGYTQNVPNNFNLNYDVTGTTLAFQIFTLKNSTLYNIQSKPIPFNNSDTFNIGYTTPLSGTHRISYSSSDGDLGGSQPIYLNDRVLSGKTNLKLSAYTFSTSAATFNNRFFISFI